VPWYPLIVLKILSCSSWCVDQYKYQEFCIIQLRAILTPVPKLISKIHAQVACAEIKILVVVLRIVLIIREVMQQNRKQTLWIWWLSNYTKQTFFYFCCIHCFIPINLVQSNFRHLTLLLGHNEDFGYFALSETKIRACRQPLSQPFFTKYYRPFCKKTRQGCLQAVHLAKMILWTSI